MKEKRRSNEKRKEKSRDAARCRRSRETDIFTELAGALPVSACDVANLDKASVMRLAIAYLKTRTLMDSVSKPLLAKRENSPDMDELFVKALDGFVLAVDNNGDMAYLSPNVKNYLGIAQMDLMGQSVFDYSHPCDHDEIRESLCMKPSEPGEDQPCNFFLRLKCTLTSKGRKVNLKSASYRVIHCTGRVIAHSSSNVITSNEENNETEKPEESVEKEAGASLVVVASPVPHPSNIEIPLGKYTFLSKHNLNMKFTYADDKLAEFLGWEGSDLIGQSVLDFHHALDNSSLDKSFKSLFHKGQCETAAYRFLNKRGGYAWVVTQATLIHCSRLHKPLSVVCVNYMISGVECEDEVYSVRQLEARTSRPLTSAEARKPLGERNGQQLPLPPLCDSRNKPEEVRAKPQAVVKAQPRLALPAKENTLDQSPPSQLDQLEQLDRAAVGAATLLVEPAAEAVAEAAVEPAVGRRSPSGTTTETIFVPRTEDMSKGFLTFSEDNDGITMLKDEPEDLTHLAPMAGDVCVPLEEPPFLSDMLDEFMLSSANYCPLLGPDDDDDAADDSSRHKRCDVASSPDSAGLQHDDPFVYPDSPGLGHVGSQAPAATSPTSRVSFCRNGTQSPATSDSLGEAPRGTSLGPGEAGGLSDDEMLMLSMSDVMADDEMSIRAPFIPMSDQDEALQLLISDDMVMWGGGPTHSNQSTHKKSKWLTEAMDEGPNSSLAQLLMNEASSNKARLQQQQQQQQQQAGGETGPRGPGRKEGKRTCGKRVLSGLPGRPGPLDTKRPKHCGQFDLEDALSMHSSQLLHQLVSHQQQLHQQAKGCWPARPARPGHHDSSLEGDGGGGKLEPPPAPAHQSSSVLMNLLVSGCDMQPIQNPTCNANIRVQPQQQQQQQQQLLQQNMDELQFLQQSKLSPQQINLEKLQTVPEWTQPAPRGFDNLKQQQHHQDLVTMNYDEFMKNIFEENDELLCALDPNLV